MKLKNRNRILQWDIKALKKYENVVTCLDSFCYCLNSLKTVVGTKYRLQGTVAALICLYTREHCSDKIKLL